MIVEAGDYFQVIRGMAVSSTPMSLLFGDNESTIVGVRYDRSYCELVFRAIEICDPFIFCKCVWSNVEYKKDSIGKIFSLNLTELEVMILSINYIQSLEIKL